MFSQFAFPESAKRLSGITSREVCTDIHLGLSDPGSRRETPRPGTQVGGCAVRSSRVLLLDAFPPGVRSRKARSAYPGSCRVRLARAFTLSGRPPGLGAAHCLLIRQTCRRCYFAAPANMPTRQRLARGGIRIKAESRAGCRCGWSRGSRCGGRAWRCRR